MDEPFDPFVDKPLKTTGLRITTSTIPGQETAEDITPEEFQIICNGISNI
jgi:hypothetical protein